MHTRARPALCTGTRSRAVVAQSSGMWLPKAHCGEHVRPGSVLGQIVGLFGELLAECTVPVAGRTGPLPSGAPEGKGGGADAQGDDVGGGGGGMLVVLRQRPRVEAGELLALILA